ncbi:universal stress protein [Mucilaginibacter sp. RS28]|uniref:Universal stress protein n=1 Tax=Mucilaginibacter straminoryzae TaxID=2932774 RepID=A0A9X1X5C2_9SPHI|nr:universal stress protein [Mucilaginibacter straminoryzae]MCJ8208969.1 universal stress protein [Mucilaginibacter straminoryzae]
MKRILVPTDFSEAAENAARYALNLAISLKADIELVNAMKVPAETPMAAQVAWPLEDYNDVRNQVYFELKALAAKLKADEIDLTLNHPAAYRPVIKESSEVGNVSDVVRNMVSAHTAQMVVMGMSGAGSLSRFFIGSNSREMIDKAGFPVLLIPPHCGYKRIEKIAFATALSQDDVDVVHQLCLFATPLNAEILLVHVTEEQADNGNNQKKIDGFLNEITCKINYPKIYYRHIKGPDVNAGLDWLTENGRVDMLAMVHRKAGILKDIFEGSHTQRMARHISLPLMVFPGAEKHSALPIF